MSLNEIVSLVKSAGRGAGLAQGLAEEAGKSAAWLVAAGLDDGEATAAALDSVAGRCQSDRLCMPCQGCLAGDAQSLGRALCVGPPAVDRLALNAEPLVLGPIDRPLLILGLAAWRSRELAIPLAVTWTGAGGPVLADCRGGEVSLEAFSAQGLAEDRDRSVTLARGAAEPPADPTVSAESFAATRAAALEAGLTLAPEAQRRILLHFQASLVESTEQSRISGAGAGLVDRD